MDALDILNKYIEHPRESSVAGHLSVMPTYLLSLAGIACLNVIPRNDQTHHTQQIFKIYWNHTNHVSETSSIFNVQFI
jgi:hypothetical protein